MPQPDLTTRTEAFLERWRGTAGAILAPLAFAVTYCTTAGHLKPEGQRLSAILAAVAVLWISEALPLPMTAVLGACLSVVLGVANVKQVLAPFADPIVFLFFGSFVLARAMTCHGLDRRLALSFLSLRWVGGHPTRVLLMMGAATALVSMWISNTATAAMMMPIALGVLNALNEVRKSADSDAAGDLRSWPFATALMLTVAYSASIGGIGTPVGSPPNLICIGQLRELAIGVDLSFFRWMMLMVPLLAVMFIVLVALISWQNPGNRLARGSAEELTKFLKLERELLGRWTAGQINTLIAFSLAVVLWILPGVCSILLAKDHPVAAALTERVPEAVAAMLAATLLFVLPTNLRRGEFTMDWREASRIDWGTLLLFGGGLSLGALMFQTGVAEALGRSLIDSTGIRSLWSLTAAAVAVGILISELSSNTAAANMVVPVVIALSQSAGVNPVPPALGACLGASFGFMLPVSTPPNAIAYGTGLVPITKMVRAGVLYDVSGFVVIVLGLRILCPLFGLG